MLDEAVAMIACMRACSGQGRVLVGGSPNLPLQDACLRVCGGRAVAATARFTETLPQLPAKKDTAVACTLSSVWGQWRARSRADHWAARCHCRNSAVHSITCAWPHSMHGCAYWMPHWRDLTSDLYRLQLFISFDFRDFGQAQHKPRLRAISVLLHTLCGRYTAPTRASPAPPFFAISLAVLVRIEQIASGMNVSWRGDVRNTCVHMCSNSLAPKGLRQPGP